MSKLKKDDFKENENEEQKIEEGKNESENEAQIVEKIKVSNFARNASSEEDMGYRSMENISSDSLDGDLNLSDFEDFGSIRANNKKEKKKRRRG